MLEKLMVSYKIKQYRYDKSSLFTLSCLFFGLLYRMEKLLLKKKKNALFLGREGLKLQANDNKWQLMSCPNITNEKN